MIFKQISNVAARCIIRAYSYGSKQRERWFLAIAVRFLPFRAALFRLLFISFSGRALAV